MDKMVVEVPAGMYREWRREHMASKRNRDQGKNYRHISLESIAEVEDARADFANMDAVVGSASETHRSQKALKMLRNSLAEWKPWAVDLLDFYLLGRRKDCTDVIAQKYGVSSRMVRKYKKQFENFIAAAQITPAQSSTVYRAPESERRRIAIFRQATLQKQDNPTHCRTMTLCGKIMIRTLGSRFRWAGLPLG